MKESLCCRGSRCVVGEVDVLQVEFLDFRRLFWIAGCVAGLQEVLLDCRRYCWIAGGVAALQEVLLGCMLSICIAENTGTAGRLG